MRFTTLIIILSTILVYPRSICAQSVAKIRGQVIGRNADKVYLYTAGSLRQGAQVVDSVKVSNQFFAFSRTLQEPGAYFLSLPDTPGQFYFIWDKDVVIFLKADNLDQSIVEESPVNEALKSFSDTVEAVYNNKLKDICQLLSQVNPRQDTSQVRQLYQSYYTIASQQQHAVISYIRDHRHSWVTLFMMVHYHRDLGRRLTLDLLSAMPKELQQSQVGTQLRTTVDDSSYPIIP